MLVLFAQELTDAARFLVLGLGVGLAAPIAAAAGGALGGGVLAGLAWGAPQVLEWRMVRWARRVFGGGLLLAAIILFLREFSLV